jgi:hypothetical protein
MRLSKPAVRGILDVLVSFLSIRQDRVTPENRYTTTSEVNRIIWASANLMFCWPFLHIGKDEGFAEWRLYGEGLSSLLKELVRNLTHCVVFLARSLLLAFDVSKNRRS